MTWQVQLSKTGYCWQQYGLVAANEDAVLAPLRSGHSNPEKMSHRRATRNITKRELLLLVTAILVGLYFRTFRLDELPRGMTADEAVFGLAAVSITRGEEYPIFLRGMGSTLPLHSYLIALLFRLFGSTILTARAAAALVGIATLPLLYLLARKLFPSTGRTWSSSLTAGVATCFLATSYWHIVYSRLGIEPILVPFFGTATLYCLWRAWELRSRRLFILTGLLMGLSLYTYPAAYVFPLLVLVLLVYCLWRHRRLLHEHLVNLLLVFAVCSAVVAPLGLFALTHLDDFMSRAAWVSAFNPEVAHGSPVIEFVKSSAKTAAMFSVRGDSSPVHNPARRPVLDPLTSIWFVVGLIASIRSYRERTHFLLLTWLVIGCLPAVVTVLGVPHYSRAIAALPATCLLPALGIRSALEWFDARVSHRRLSVTVAILILSISLLLTAATAYGDYFIAWDTRLDLRQGYDAGYVAAAQIMNETDVPDSIWILPHTRFVPSGFGADHIDFLYDGAAPYYGVSLDETTAPDELSRICQARSKALVIDWKGYVLDKAYEAMAADPKRLIPFLFQKYGSELNRRSYESFDVVTYRLPKNSSFTIADSFQPVEVDFGGELMVVGAAWGGSSSGSTSTPEEVATKELPAGKSGWVALRWRALRPAGANYKVSVYLQDQGGHVAGQADKLLLSNDLHPTSEWQAGQEEIDYYTLPAWEGTAPGRYTVGVTVYEAETLDVLATAGRRPSYVLGTLNIVPPTEPGHVAPEVNLAAQAGERPPNIDLLGYDLPHRELNPGDTFSVALYWKAVKDVEQDYLVAVQFTGEQGWVLSEQPDHPVYGTYPTSEWSDGEVLRDWHDVPFPPDMPPGNYQMSVLISEDGNSFQQFALERIQLSGRARQFTVPPIQHRLDARLGETIRFLGFDLSSDRVRSGGALGLTLYWQALEESQFSYTVFTHLLDGENQIWGQTDSIPGQGEAPTTSWLEGEIVTDEYEILVDPETPVGECFVEIGMYDASTGERLPVYDMASRMVGDHIVLPPIEVVVGP